MWTLNAYAGDGRIRLRPFLDLSDPGDRARLEPLAREIYDLVIEAGGTISASQGCGLARTQFLPRQYGEVVQVFREIKDAFDPSNLLNPGKVIGDDPHLMVRDLKRFPTLPLALDYDSGSVLGRLARRRAQVLFGVLEAEQRAEPGGESGSAAREHAGTARRLLGDPAGASMAGARRTGDGLGLPRLRRMPDPGAHLADVPELSALTAARRRRPGPWPTCSGRSPSGRSIPSSGGPSNSRRMPASASIASSASPNVRRAWMSRA